MVRLDGLHVPAGSTVTFDPQRSTVLEVTGNVHVEGILRMRPSRPDAVHTLRFLNVKEGRFVGGNVHHPVATDVGLWVTQRGVLDAAGSRKTPWTRLKGGAAAGATDFVVADARGWEAGDEVVVCPTAKGDYTGFDRRTITAVHGNRVTVDRGLARSHPPVKEWTAEVINLTRNVVVEGTPGGRAHVMFLQLRAAQSIENVEFRHLGPAGVHRNGLPEGVTGRYPLHFHHCDDGSVGSLVAGVVIHDSGSRGFVPHESDGITFRGCASFDTLGAPYWWDPGERTHSTIWDGCLAAKVRVNGSNRYTNTGFLLGRGGARPAWTKADEQAFQAYVDAAGGLPMPNVRLNTCVNCVAVGVEGADASGASWQAASNLGVWLFERFFAHNISSHGIRVWQNSGSAHPIFGGVIYHCGSRGLSHGAYGNPYNYAGFRFHDAGEYHHEQHAQSKVSAGFDYDQDGHDELPVAVPMRFVDMAFNGPILLSRGPAEAQAPAEYRRCSGISRVDIDGNANSYCAWDFVDCDLSPTQVRIVKAPRGGFTLRAQDGSSAWKMEESGRATVIPPFA